MSRRELVFTKSSGIPVGTEEEVGTVKVRTWELGNSDGTGKH